jgi:transposase
MRSPDIPTGPKRDGMGRQLRITMDCAYLRFCGAPQNRKGIDSLAALCRNQWQQDPFSGTLYVFRNRAATALKLVVYDGNGFWLCLRRFSSGKLLWWPVTEDAPLHPLAAPQLMVLLYQGHPEQAHFSPLWRPLC